MVNQELEHTNNNESKVLRVIHKESGKLEVHFPFSKVPVEMSPDYFKKNINPDHYVIDFEDDFDHPLAG